jgi:hypothetical protein
MKIIRVIYLHFASPPNLSVVHITLSRNDVLTMIKKLKLPPLPPLRPLLPSNLTPIVASKINPEAGVKKVGVPFFRDPVHAAPTLSLYRSLLRSTKSHPTAATSNPDGAPDKIDWVALRRSIKEGWKKRKGLTSIPQTHIFLATQHDLLRSLTPATPEILKYSQTLAQRQISADKRAIPPPERKPYLAGYLRPTHFNPPLPRLKPQPLSISLMIKKRIAARARRLETQRSNMESWNDIHSEMGLMRRLHEREGLEDMKGFRDQLEGFKGVVQGGYERDEARRRGVFGYGVVRRVERARRSRQEWKRLKTTAKNELSRAENS